MIANTGDDVEMYGVHVSPDPDLVTYWLADAIDERGYGIRGDTWEVMDALEAPGGRRGSAWATATWRCAWLRTERLAGGASADRGPRRRGARRWASTLRVLPATDAPAAHAW